ncbi:tetratricopeptide repeat protein [Bryobacterales bacterium F-183]|nr:tetratricopeptide repeat protein [Bryobacterales bacterium F-183]
MAKPRDPSLPSLLQDRFTDREEPLQLFHRYLDSVEGPFPALMFYGMGGIGKSWLIRKLRLALTGVHAVPAVLIDYTREQDSNPFLSDSLLFLAEVRKLTERPCPQFDLAFAFTLVKRYRLDEAALEHSVKNAGAGMFWEAVKAAGGALNPVLGGALSMMEKAYGAVKDKAALSAIRERFLKDVAGLRAKELAALEDELCFRLSEDLQADDAFPLRPAHRAVRAVVFVDTLEALIPAGMSEVAEERASMRLRELIYALRDRVLFIIAGQNRLDWKFIDAIWEDRAWLEQHRLSGLSDPDARDFLNRCNLRDPGVQQAILDKCLWVGEGQGYHPASLGLFADIGWLELRAKRVPTPALFAEVNKGDMASLVRRFLKSLPSEVEQEWVRRLAVTPTFDEAAARAMHSESWSVAQDLAIDMLRGLSFLVPSTSDAGWYSVDSSVQDALQHTGEVPNAWHERWRAYWKSRGNDALEWFHHWRLDSRAALAQWVASAEATRSQLDMVQHAALLKWWEPTAIIDAPPTNGDAAAALVALGVEYELGSLGPRDERCQRAILCLEFASRFCTKDQSPVKWAEIQNHLGNAWSYMKDGGWAVNLKKAISCFVGALEVYTDPLVRARVQNNLGLAYIYLARIDGREYLTLAIQCLENAQKAFHPESQPYFWAGTTHNLAMAYSKDGDAIYSQKAIDLFNQTLTVYRRETFPYQWAKVHENLGIVYGGLRDSSAGNLEKSIACFERCLEIRTAEAFPEDWASSQFNLGVSALSLAKISSPPLAEYLDRAERAFAAAKEGYAKLGLIPETEDALAAIEEVRRLSQHSQSE